MTSYVLAMDVGGTFLDTIVTDDQGAVTTTKVLSTHEDYAKCIRAAVTAVGEKLGLSEQGLLERCRLVINGTTVATNVLAELKGPRVGLLTTRGFADTQYIGRIQRWDAVDLSLLSPLPQIVPRERIVELAERIDKTGAVVTPLDEAHVEARLRELVEDHGCEAIAVSLLWSFLNASHEQLVGAVAARLYPDLPVSLSSQVFPAIREYERTNTTVIDAFISPGVRKYLHDLEGYFRDNGFKGALRMVHAAGGVSTPEEVRRAPVTLINSGPVAGYVGAMKFGARSGRANIITADVGGTSFDTGLIYDGALSLRHRTMVPAPGHPSPGYLTGLSMMDVSAIGTGGGSIGWLDARGMVRVGPRSAGSRPGPACFGRGGQEPTLTDACVVLNLLDPDNFLGGAQKLDREAALTAVRTRLMQPLGLPSEYEAAAAMYRLALVDMASNVRKMSIDKGHDPREFALFSYGGAGGLFLAPVSALAAVPEMVAPENCAVFSAMGALMSDYRRSALSSCAWRLGEDPKPVAAVVKALEGRLMGEVAEAGIPAAGVRLERTADMRFVGQNAEMTTPLPPGPIGNGFSDALAATFRAEYARSFGADALWLDAALEVVNVRVTAVAESAALSPPLEPPQAEPPPPVPTSIRQVFWPFTMTFAPWPIYARGDLAVGAKIAGPAIVESADTTIVIPPGCKATIDQMRSIVMDVTAHEHIDDE